MNNSFSQEQILYFITHLISLVENKSYSIREVYLSKKYRSPDDKVKISSNMSIIADDAYWEYIDSTFIKGAIYPEDSYTIVSTEKGHAIFLKYGYKNIDCHAYKKVSKNSEESPSTTYLDELSYIMSGIDKLYTNANLVNCYEDSIINATLIEIKENLNSISLCSNKKCKELIKKLNSLAIFRKSARHNYSY